MHIWLKRKFAVKKCFLCPSHQINTLQQQIYIHLIILKTSLYLSESLSDIAVLMDIPADILRDEIRNRATEVSAPYHRGKAASRVKLHHQEMLLAQVGSPLAIENAHRNLLDMEDDE